MKKGRINKKSTQTNNTQSESYSHKPMHPLRYALGVVLKYQTTVRRPKLIRLAISYV